MIILYILIGIAALLLLLCHVPITVDIKTKDELSLKLWILFIPITITPKKEKPIKLSDWKIKKYRKRRLKEYERYLKKKLLDEAKKKKKEEQENKKNVQTKKQEKSKKGVNKTLDLTNNVVLKALKNFGRRLKINVYHIRITVGGKEPDKTALTYGYVCQGMSYMNEFIKNHANVRYPGRVKRRLYVGIDYLNPRTDLDIHLSLRIKVHHILSLGVGALISYLTMQNSNGSDKTNKATAVLLSKTVNQ